MARGGGRRTHATQDFRMARARSVDRAWAEQHDRLSAAAMPLCTDWSDREADVRDDLLEVLCESVAQVAGLNLDPDCRALRHPSHTCHNRDGKPLQRFQTCWVEACLQVQEQGTVIHAAEQAVG